MNNIDQNDIGKCRNRSNGTYVYGETIESGLERLHQQKGEDLAKVKDLESRQIDNPTLAVSPDSSATDVLYVATKAFTLHSGALAREKDWLGTEEPVLPVRDIPKGGRVTEADRQDHALVKGRLEDMLKVARTKLAKTKALIQEHPDRISDRSFELKEVIEGYLISFNVDMSDEALEAFKRDIREKLPTRARKVRNPEGVEVWCMPSPEMNIVPNMAHITLSEPVESIWRYRQ